MTRSRTRKQQKKTWTQYKIEKMNTCADCKFRRGNECVKMDTIRVHKARQSCIEYEKVKEAER